MNDRQIIESYKSMVNFIADILGEECEVVLHDLSTADMSVVAIRNGHLSGRSIGSPATNLALRVLKESNNVTDCDYIANYSAESSTGKKFRAATYFIKNDKKRIIGMLCVNIRLELFEQFSAYLSRFISVEQGDKLSGLIGNQPDTVSEKPVENLNKSVGSIFDQAILDVAHKMNVEPARMTADERQQAIKSLYDEGLFVLKGGVSEVARIFNVSESTVYRHMQAVMRKEGGNSHESDIIKIIRKEA